MAINLNEIEYRADINNVDKYDNPMVAKVLEKYNETNKK